MMSLTPNSPMRLPRTAARLEQIPTSIVVLSIAAIAGGCTVPHMIAPENADNYYAWASVRLGQEGSVVLHFSIGPDGKAREPISHDEARIVDQGHSLDDRAAAQGIEQLHARRKAAAAARRSRRSKS
jgi:hypothetical protein